MRSASAKAATEKAEAGAPASEWLGTLMGAMATVEPCWRTHIALEEKTATQALFDGLMATEAQVALLRALSQHGQQNGHVPQLSVAFTLYNLDANDRAAVMRLMPPQVTQELMPGPWRAQWSPMEPYLLS